MGVAGRDAYIQDAQQLKVDWEKRKQDVEAGLDDKRKAKEEAEGAWGWFGASAGGVPGVGGSL